MSKLTRRLARITAELAQFTEAESILTDAWDGKLNDRAEHPVLALLRYRISVLNMQAADVSLRIRHWRGDKAEAARSSERTAPVPE